MELNYLLSTKGIDTKESRVLVMRHTPKEAGLRKALPWLAADQPNIFNAYQQSQYLPTEKKMARAAYIASFIGWQAKEALFVGLYSVNGQKPISYEEYWKISANIELQKLGMTGWADADTRATSLWFNLELMDVLQEWKGKLIVDWPPPDIQWTRWANDNQFRIKAILEESTLDKDMPVWNELVLTWEELAHLPKSWIIKLSQWRGIYFIVDGADGKGYVGSAYGEENLYGRWRNYAASGDGGNKLLRLRSPEQFLISILELVSPTMKREDVNQLEGNWKKRLHTRKFGLNLN